MLTLTFPWHDLPDWLPLAANESLQAVGYVAAAIAGAVAIYIWNKLQGADARTQSRTLLDQAKLEAGNVVREAELEAKAKALEQQRKAESDLQAARDALRDRETATIRR
jgi:hypothetical protein